MAAKAKSKAKAGAKGKAPAKAKAAKAKPAKKAAKAVKPARKAAKAVKPARKAAKAAQPAKKAAQPAKKAEKRHANPAKAGKPAKAAKPAQKAPPARAAATAKAAVAAKPAPRAAEKAAPRAASGLPAITLETTVARPAGEVWVLVSSAKGLERWLCTEAKLDAKPGGKARLRAGPDLVLEGRLAALDRGRRVTLDLTSGGGSSVSISLESLAGAATTVRVRHEGHAGDDGGQAAYAAHKALWETLLRNLKSVAETGLDRRHSGRGVVRSSHIDAKPARVWRALTDRHDLARWLCLAAVLDPREGGSFRFDWTGSEHSDSMGGGLFAEGTVLTLEPERLLEFAYHVPKFGAGAHPTLISWAVEPEGDGTRLHMRHTGFDHDAAWTEYFEGHRECWDIDTEELVALCERDNPGKVLRCEVAIDAGRAVGAFDAIAAAIGGREIERGGGPEGRYVVFARGAGAGMFGVGNAGRYPRTRAFLEPRDDEVRLVVTETHLEPNLDVNAAYARWKATLAPLAAPGAEVRAGSIFS